MVKVDLRTADDVGDHFSVTNLLISHVFNEETVFGREARGLEL